MKKLTTIYKNFDIFFCFGENKIYFQQNPILIFSDTFKQTTLIRISKKPLLQIKMQLWSKNRNIEAFKTFYKFWSSLNLYHKYLNLNKGYFVKLDLIGLGFRVVKISERIFFFSLGWANGVYFLVPQNLRVFILSKTRQIMVFGFNANKVFNIISMLILLRKTRPYRITGFVNPLFIQRLRSGKQR